MTEILTLFVLAVLLAHFCPLIKEKENIMSSIDLSAFKEGYATDLDKEVSGVWNSLSMLPKTRVKVARTGNVEYEKMLRKLYKPYSRILRKGKDLDPEIQEEITNKLIANTILKDWENMPGENGSTVPFSIKEAYALVSQPGLKELKEEIQGFADDFASFQEEDESDIVKN